MSSPLTPALLDALKTLARQRAAGHDPAHDFLHVARVALNAQRISATEGGRLEVVLPAAWLHELFNYPKHHPDSRHSGEVCARHAQAALQQLSYPLDLQEEVAYCIRVHPYSLGIVPDTLEARILQDADRLDAIGAIGIARCFSTGAVMNAQLYHPEDPLGQDRELDDKAYSVDHFYKKLLRLPATLHTETARRLARERVETMELFLQQLRRELAE